MTKDYVCDINDQQHYSETIHSCNYSRRFFFPKKFFSSCENYADQDAAEKCKDGFAYRDVITTDFIKNYAKQ